MTHHTGTATSTWHMAIPYCLVPTCLAVTHGCCSHQTQAPHVSTHLGVVADAHAAHDDAVAQAHTVTNDTALSDADIGAQLAVHTNLGCGGNQHLQEQW